MDSSNCNKTLHTQQDQAKKVTNVIELTPTKWKELMDEVFSPMFEKDLGLKYKGGYIWAGEWENHKRKIIKVFLINNSFGTLQWGWCFDFVPKIKDRGLQYYRTEKSVNIHLMEYPFGFLAASRYPEEREATTLRSVESNITIEQLKDQHRETYRYLKERIQKYFERTKEYSGLVKEVDDKLSTSYYKWCHDFDLTVVKSFLLASIGDKDAAIKTIDLIDFTKQKPGLRQKILDKFELAEQTFRENKELLDKK